MRLKISNNSPLIRVFAIIQFQLECGVRDPGVVLWQLGDTTIYDTTGTTPTAADYAIEQPEDGNTKYYNLRVRKSVN